MISHTITHRCCEPIANPLSVKGFDCPNPPCGATFYNGDKKFYAHCKKYNYLAEWKPLMEEEPIKKEKQELRRIDTVEKVTLIKITGITGIGINPDPIREYDEYWTQEGQFVFAVDHWVER